MAWKKDYQKLRKKKIPSRARVPHSILHIDCKHENLGANDNDLIKTDNK
jgi:hypothetical protein